MDEGDEGRKDAGPQRRVRTKFSSEQIKKLERIFIKQKYLDSGEREKTAQKLNLTETQVRRASKLFDIWIYEDQTSPICSVLRMLTELFFVFVVSGEDLVSEPKDEAETGSPRLSHSPSPAGHFSASVSGSVPQHGWTSTPLLSYGPSLLPITCPAAAPPSAHASSLPSSNNDTPPTFLLRNCHFRDFSLHK